MSDESTTVEADKAPRIPGSLSVWQGIATALGGAILAAFISVGKLEERDAARAASIATLERKVDALTVSVNSLSLEVARQGVTIERLNLASNGGGQGLRRRSD